MQHPNSECQRKQEEILRNCPEELREEYARSFRCSNAAYIYHQLANESQASEKCRLFMMNGLTAYLLKLPES